MCYSFHLGPVFQVILCLFSGEVNPRLYFAKDGQQYICARLLSIKAMIVKIYGFASYHRRFGVVLLRVRFIAPLWKRLLIVFDIIQLIDATSISTLIKFFFPSLLTLGLYRANLGYYLSPRIEK